MVKTCESSHSHSLSQQAKQYYINLSVPWVGKRNWRCHMTAVRDSYHTHVIDYVALAVTPQTLLATRVTLSSTGG